MIRVAILASTLSRAQSLATLLAEDERLEIVEVRASLDRAEDDRFANVDILVAANLQLDRIPSNGPPVIVLANEHVEALPLGRAIRACLPINSSSSEIAAAIVAGANDLVVLTQVQARDWLSGAHFGHADGGFKVEALTPRELQVLRMLADGFGNKEIAGQLNISDHTAKFHVAQILAKLRASSRTEAVAIGIRRGLVPI